MPLMEIALLAGEDFIAADAAATAAGEAALMGDVGMGAAGAAGIDSLGAASGFGGADIAAMGDVGMGAYGLPMYGAADAAGMGIVGAVPNLPLDTAAMGNVGMGADVATDINAMGNVGTGIGAGADVNAMGDVGMGAYGAPTAGAPGSAWDSVTRWWDGLSPFQKTMMGIGAFSMMSPKNQLQTQQPYMGGNLQYFKYDPRTYQPVVTTPPTAYTPQYRRYAEGGGVDGRMPGAMTIETMDPVIRMAGGGLWGLNDGEGIGQLAAMFGLPSAQPSGTWRDQYAYNPDTHTYRQLAQGGISNLGSYSDGGQLLRGPGDGMSDNIPANISGKQPARLADGEFVVSADVVSGLGNGSTDAGAKQLYKMMDRVRSARTGTKKQGREINPNKYMPA